MNAIVNLKDLYRLVETSKVDRHVLAQVARAVRGLQRSGGFIAFIAGGALGLGVCCTLAIDDMKKQILDLECKVMALEHELDKSREDDCK